MSELHMVIQVPDDWSRVVAEDSSDSGSGSQSKESAEQGLTTPKEAATTFWQRVQRYSESTIGTVMRRGTLPMKRSMMMRLDRPISDLQALVNCDRPFYNPPQETTVEVRVCGGWGPLFSLTMECILSFLFAFGRTTR